MLLFYNKILYKNKEIIDYLCLKNYVCTKKYKQIRRKLPILTFLYFSKIKFY